MEFIPRDPDFVRRVSESFARQSFMGFIGATLEKVGPGYCEIHLPFRADLLQQHSFFHAGAIGTIADSAAGYAAYSLMESTSSVLSVEFKLNLLSPAEGDSLIARAHVLKYGKTLSVCRSDVFVIKQGAEKLCAASQSTMIELQERGDGGN